jgi:protein phosphatase
MEQLTEDHSLVNELLKTGRLSREEAETHPQRSVITRALGTDPDVDVDTFSVQAENGDLFLLCSDGLTDLVEDAELGELAAGPATPEAACQALVALANQRGGHDNISVALLRVLGLGSERRDKTVEVGREPRDTVVDAPPHTVAMTRADSAPPTPNMGDDGRRNTVPTLVDPLVLAAAQHRPTTLLEGQAPRAQTPLSNPAVPTTVPPRRPTHWPIWISLGVCALILIAIAVWSALR